MTKRWLVSEACSPEWIAVCGEHPTIAQLLWTRGIRTKEEIQPFFHPSYEDHLHDPFLFSNMSRGVETLFKAIDGGKHIVVFGDYDADGLTGSTVVLSTLKAISPEAKVTSYIPHRDKEGYGLQMASVKELVKEGAQLIITVDCGIACVQEIAYARSQGVDVIVLDHHQFGETLPDGILIHPSIPGESYPFKHLAAVGVSWKFAIALVHEGRKRGLDIPDGFEKWLLDLVAIATVTDVVPLLGENRVLEHFGLKVLNKSRRLGLRALMTSGMLRFGEVNTRDIGFVIGPRLNATSRMDHAKTALKLLLSETEAEAWSIAQEIESLNRKRQETMASMMREAEIMLKTSDESDVMQVLFSKAWSPALVGLVAGRVSDQRGIPAVAIGKHGSQWIGSGRSFEWYDITDALKRSGDGLLTRVGGHVQACGFALASDAHVPILKERLMRDAETRIKSDQIGAFVQVDAEINLQDIDWKLIERLGLLAPHGHKNPEPVFVSKNVEVTSSGTVGNDAKHLRVVGRQNARVQKFIAFGLGKRVEEAMQGACIDILYTLGINIWNGSREIQCKVVDFRQATSVVQDSLKDRLEKVGLIN